MNYGYIKSKIDRDEHHFYKTQPVGMNFTYTVQNVIDQGEDPICAACAASVFLSWNKYDVDPWELFDKAGGTPIGISYKDMLKYLRKIGAIQEYCMVHSELALKTAIVVNGPCLGALNVRNPESCQFWDGSRLVGGHAVAIIGWNEKGFIIQNSWGDGCAVTTLPYDRFNLFLEIWTIIA